MRNFDLSPLYRSTIGFDRLASMIDQVANGEDRSQGYPPYDIEKTGETDYRISIAVAGFSRDEIAIEAKGDELAIRGEKTRPEVAAVYLHRGIAGRDFERRFRLADHVKVVGAVLENGLLHVDLRRETPEALKPRRIAITTVEPAGPDGVDAVETRALAAGKAA